MSALPQPEPTPTPAGWYSDPWQQAPFRWWDGAQWTAHVSQPQPTAHVSAADQQRALLANESAWQLYPNAPVHPVPKLSAADGGNRKLLGVSFGQPQADPTAVEAVWRDRGLTAHPVERMRNKGVGGFRLSINGMELGNEDQFEFDFAGLALNAGLLQKDVVGGNAMTVLSGVPWHAAANATIAVVNICERDVDRDSNGNTNVDYDWHTTSVIQVPLSQAVASRFPGVLLTRRKTLLRAPSNWTKQSFESMEANKLFKTRIAPSQDLVAVYELFNPAFLHKMAMSENEVVGQQTGRFAAMIAKNFTANWQQILIHHGHLLVVSPHFIEADEPNAMLQAVTKDKSITHLDLVDSHLGLVRDIHRRLESEWQ